MEYRSAFVPLDPKWPPQRVAQVISQAGLSVLIATDKAEKSAASLRVGALEMSNQPNCPIIHVSALLNDQNCGAHLSPDRSLTDRDASNIPRDVPPLPLPWCYVMFTSGSTGSPLGVLGTEQGILNRCRWMARQEFEEDEDGKGVMKSVPLILPGDRVAVKTSVGFVDSIWEAFAPLLLPASSVILSPDLMLRPAALIEALRAHRLTHLASVPSLLQLLLQALNVISCKPLRYQLAADPGTGDAKQTHPQGGHGYVIPGNINGPLCLRVVISSGEPLPWGLAEGLIKGLPKGCKLLNLYGGWAVGYTHLLSICTLIFTN